MTIAADPGARTANRMIVHAQEYFRSERGDPQGVRVCYATLHQREVMLIQRRLPESSKSNRRLKKTYSNPIEIIKYCAPKSPHMLHVWCSFSELPAAILIFLHP